MNVLLVSQYFTPETGATSNRVLSLAEALLAAGHSVHVIAEKPNHPEGVIWPEYKKGLFVDKYIGSIPVTYTAVYATPRKDTKARISSYLSFMISAILAGFRIRKQFDVVLASSPPLLVGAAGWALAKLKRARFVFDVRDLWPALAIALGELQNPLAIRLAEALERFLYHHADGIAAVTQQFCDTIRNIVGPRTPIALVMNGTLPVFFVSGELRVEMRRQLQLDGKFVVTYAGNVGVCQGLEHILNAAEELQGSNSHILFQIVGNGPAKESLIMQAQERGLNNISFLSRVPLEAAAGYMAAADALLVPLAHNEMCAIFVPSKLFDSMAAGRPVLLSVDGEARRILDQSGAGLYYPPEDGKALAGAARWLAEHPAESSDMGARGRLYASVNCMRSQQGARMVEFLLRVSSPEKQLARVTGA